MNIDPDPVVSPRVIQWPFGIILFGACLFGLGYCAARASDIPAERTWQIYDETTNKPFHPHKFATATACNVDIGGIKDGNGRRLACRRISTKGE